MKGLDPVTLEEYELEEWLNMDIDNIIVILKYSSNKKPYLIKKSYFISPLINNIYKECVINNKQLNITETISKINPDYRNLGFYLGSPLLVENKPFIKMLNKKSNRIFEIEGHMIFGSEFINLEYLELSQIVMLKKKDAITKKNLPDNIDIYFDTLSQAALRNYSYQWDQAMNLYLRQGEGYWTSDAFKSRYKRFGDTIDEAANRVKDKINYIDKCFLEFAPRADKKVFYWRGQKNHFLDAGGYPMRDVGSNTIAKNFISVSDNKQVAKNFARPNGILYKIMLQKGIPHINMKRTTQFKHEKEILLPRNLVYTLIDKQDEVAINPVWDDNQNKIITKQVTTTIYILQVGMMNENQFDIPTTCKHLKVGHLTPINVKLPKSVKNKASQEAPVLSDEVHKLKRCPNGTKRNKKTGNCEPKDKPLEEPVGQIEVEFRNFMGEEGPAPKPVPSSPPQSYQASKRCPNGTRKNNKTGNCDKKKLPKCPNGTRRNKNTGNCEPK
jgi:hypothetical protein